MNRNSNALAQTELQQQIGSAQRRIINILKTRPGSTTASLADSLKVTSAAIRLQLNELVELGLVRQQMQSAEGRGRPSTSWSLSERAIVLFPDRHSDLTVELIQSIRAALGEEALDKVLEKRDSDLLAQLEKATPANASLARKVRVLANTRSKMGYMAEVEKRGQSLLLREHHCPVCAAARECQGLCRNELELFRRYLGKAVSVERVQHLLGDDTRCAYRIELLAPD